MTRHVLLFSWDSDSPNCMYINFTFLHIIFNITYVNKVIANLYIYMKKITYTHTQKHTKCDSKRWTQLKSEKLLNTRQAFGCGIPSSLLAVRFDLPRLLSNLLNSSHVFLWYRWSAGALPLHRQPNLLKLVIPTTNALPRWRMNVETKTKRTLHSSRRQSFNEITNANLVSHSSHFSLNWRCCTALRYASALAVIFEKLYLPFQMLCRSFKNRI